MLKNGLFGLVAAVVRLLLSLASVPLLVRLLGQAEFGLWAWVSAVIGLAAVIEGGLSLSATVFLSRDLATGDRRSLLETASVGAVSMLAISVLAGSLLIITAPELLRWAPRVSTNDDPQSVVGAIRLSGIVVFCRLMQQFFVGSMQASKRYLAIAVLSLLQSVLITGGLITVAGLGGRLFELMGITAFAGAVMLALHVWAGAQDGNFQFMQFRWSWPKAMSMFRYGVSSWLTIIGGAIFGQCDRLIVGSMLGANTLGVYSVVTSIAVQINSLSSVPIQPLVPYVSQLWSSGVESLGKIASEFRRTLLLSTAISVGMAILLTALSPELVMIIFRSDADSQNTLYLQIAVVVYAFYSLNAAGYFVLFATEYERANMYFVLFFGVLALALIVILGRAYGLLGAVLGNVGFAGTFFLNVVASRRIGLPVGFVTIISMPVIVLLIVFMAVTWIDMSIVSRVALAAVSLTITLRWFEKSTGLSLRRMGAFALSAVR